MILNTCVPATELTESRATRPGTKTLQSKTAWAEAALSNQEQHAARATHGARREEMHELSVCVEEDIGVAKRAVGLLYTGNVDIRGEVHMSAQFSGP